MQNAIFIESDVLEDGKYSGIDELFGKEMALIESSLLTKVRTCVMSSIVSVLYCTMFDMEAVKSHI